MNRVPAQAGAKLGLAGLVAVPVTAGGVSLVPPPGMGRTRRRVIVSNADAANPIFISYGNGVLPPTATVSNFRLGPGLTQAFETAAALYAISTGGSVNASYITEED